MMTLYRPMEIVVLPETTYILIDHAHRFPPPHLHRRARLAEEGRAELHRLFDRQMDRREGRRPFRRAGGRDPLPQGPARRSIRPACRPHADNESVIKERIFFDKAIRRCCTTRSRSSTMPSPGRGRCSKTYRRRRRPISGLGRGQCSTDNELIKIGKETYYRGGDGNLMPTRKDQPPPDLRYFKQTRK